MSDLHRHEYESGCCVHCGLMDDSWEWIEPGLPIEFEGLYSVMVIDGYVWIRAADTDE